MTGYGKAEVSLPNKKITVEIKTLNSKQTDVHVRMPSLYRSKEIDVRNLLSKELMRGKIELFVSTEKLDGSDIPSISEEALIHYYNQLTACSAKLHHAPIGDLSSLLRLPQVMEEEKDKGHILSEEEWSAFQEALKGAVEQTVQFRKQEGHSLAKDIQSNIHIIMDLEKQLAPFESSRIESVRQKIEQALEKWAVPDIDQSRLEQELVFYAEKYDVNEERVRLTNHCEYFLEQSEEEGQVGKKLGFIAQEIGREINTLGSKANHLEIQKIVVGMKEELEKIKEQILNVL